MKKILYLYAEVMPYNLPVFRTLKDNGYEVDVVQLDKRKLTPFEYPGEEGITIWNSSAYNSYSDFERAFFMQDVCLVYVSELVNRWYWQLAWKYRHKKHIPVVVGCDAQWSGSRNNYIKKLLFPITYRQVFSHIQCAGIWQADYARRIGFKRNQIITPLLCADNEQYYKVDIEAKKHNYPKQFIFVGRLNEVKGIKEILSVWKTIQDKKGWTLTLIGSGPMEELIRESQDIVLRPFMSQKDICAVMQESGCALIPSRKEPWGLVVHEAAAAGLPIIASRCCGATYKFVIDGYNGFCIEGSDEDSLRESMFRIMESDDASLIKMSIRSRQLAQSIFPEHVAYSIMSLIK